MKNLKQIIIIQIKINTKNKTLNPLITNHNINNHQNLKTNAHHQLPILITTITTTHINRTTPTPTITAHAQFKTNNNNSL